MYPCTPRVFITDVVCTIFWYDRYHLLYYHNAIIYHCTQTRVRPPSALVPRAAHTIIARKRKKIKKRTAAAAADDASQTARVTHTTTSKIRATDTRASTA